MPSRPICSFDLAGDAVSNKTPEQLYYDWRREFDQSLDEKMVSGEYIDRTFDLGSLVFCAGYHAAYRELSQHIQFLESQLREANSRIMRLEAER